MLAVTLVVIAFVLLRGGGSRYEVRALVESAGQLVKGNLVKVGGVTVGTVGAIDLTSDNQAQITLRIDDARFKPLHAGHDRDDPQHVAVERRRAPGRRCSPARTRTRRSPTAASIKGEDTRPIVDLDQLLNTLDAQARTALQQLVHGGAVAFGSHPKQADAALAALNPALSQARQTTNELVGDQATFERALVESAGVVASVAARAGRPAGRGRQRRAGRRRGRERVAVRSTTRCGARPRRCASPTRRSPSCAAR